MVEQIVLGVLGLALTYLISEINQMQKDIRELCLKVAVLYERSIQRRSSDKNPDGTPID